MDRAHLVPQQLLKREGLGEHIPDAATWVPACRLHHGNFDNLTGGVEVGRAHLPTAIEDFCREHFLLWFLDRRYGPRAD